MNIVKHHWHNGVECIIVGDMTMDEVITLESFRTALWTLKFDSLSSNVGIASIYPEGDLEAEIAKQRALALYRIDR